MPYLIGITESDFKEYRKSFSKVEYSFDRRGELPKKNPVLLSLLANVGKGDFLDFVQNPEHASYFFKDNNSETIGIVLLIFKGKTCNIAEFAVFEHCKGFGTKLYEEVANLCRERGVYNLELWCPFAGAQEFWKKMGFYPKQDSCYYKKLSKL